MADKSIITKDKSPFMIEETFFPTLWEGMLGELTNFGFNRQSGLTLSEDDKHLFVEAALPGLKADEIDVSLEKGIISIKGEKKEEEQDKKKKFYRKAISSFNYTMSLPGKIDESKEPVAEYKNGVMRITFDKSEKSSAKKIQVKQS